MKNQNILYWCPYLENVGTVNAVVNSGISVRHNAKSVSMLRFSNEWEENEQKLRLADINILNHQGSNIAKLLKKRRYLSGRAYMIFAALIGLKYLKTHFKNQEDSYF